jgi:hypothetical protein
LNGENHESTSKFEVYFSFIDGYSSFAIDIDGTHYNSTPFHLGVPRVRPHLQLQMGGCESARWRAAPSHSSIVNTGNK